MGSGSQCKPSPKKKAVKGVDSNDKRGEEPKSIELQDFVRTLENKSSWYESLTEKERYEWLVDCYRMRVDDDSTWGDGNKHGLYELNPRHGRRIAVIKDFLLFMKLAVRNQVISESYCFPFGECLKEAAELLPYSFEKSDAKEKWGGESVFSVGPSLRRTGEAVYGKSCLPNAFDVTPEVCTNIRTNINAGVTKPFQRSDRNLFEDVGGFDVWYKLYRTIKFLS